MNIFDRNYKYARVHFYYALEFNAFDMELHAHNRHEIMYVTDGKCSIEICNKKIVLSQKQFVFIPADISHKLTVTPSSPCKILCIVVDVESDGFGLDLENLEKNSSEFATLCKNTDDYLLLSDTNNLCYAIKDFIIELEEKNSSTDYLQQIMLARVLIGLALCYIHNNQSSGMLYINKAKEYIISNLYEDFTVQQVADYVGIHSSYLQMLFQKYFSCTLINFVNAKRFEKAKYLLTNSKMDITQIAYEVGFHSRQHFGYMFKKHFSLSPMKYRKLRGLNLDVPSISSNHE